MSPKAKVSGSEKIAAVEKYLRGEDSLNHLAALLDVHHSSVIMASDLPVARPKRIASNITECILLRRVKKNSCRGLFGLAAVLTWIYVRYGIKSTRQLRDWILKYNSHEKLNTSGTEERRS
ncbi:hypothetical protein P7H16_12590 [Paenibacillus larvae]|nr:hypothetical protein [Paenibacillus larvae]MDT2247583.1 hypothetical protein [Paenibacillus larvae]